jgi:hypothetical protein
MKRAAKLVRGPFWFPVAESNQISFLPESRMQTSVIIAATAM